jgi:hypothetical protein
MTLHSVIGCHSDRSLTSHRRKGRLPAVCCFSHHCSLSYFRDKHWGVIENEEEQGCFSDEEAMLTWFSLTIITSTS